MAYRVERVASVIRDVVSEAIAERISDPRIAPLTSVTRVNVAPDLQTADVHVSVLGEEAAGRSTLRGLTSARGMIQTLLARRLDIRRCPTIRFHLDHGLKKGLAIIQELDRLNAERELREKAADPDGRPESGDDGVPT